MEFLELKIPPVVQALVIAAAMWALAMAFPALAVSLPFAISLAAGCIAAGSTVAFLGVLEFKKAQTTIDPRFPDKSARLVVDGVYKISRNPMYLGILLVLLGWAFYLMNYLTFLPLPVFVTYITRFQIQPEERSMLLNFGDEFEIYSARVRRWV